MLHLAKRAGKTRFLPSEKYKLFLRLIIKRQKYPLTPVFMDQGQPESTSGAPAPRVFQLPSGA